MKMKLIISVALLISLFSLAFPVHLLKSATAVPDPLDIKIAEAMKERALLQKSATDKNFIAGYLRYTDMVTILGVTKPAGWWIIAGWYSYTQGLMTQGDNLYNAGNYLDAKDAYEQAKDIFEALNVYCGHTIGYWKNHAAPTAVRVAIYITQQSYAGSYVGIDGVTSTTGGYNYGSVGLYETLNGVPGITVEYITSLAGINQYDVVLFPDVHYVTTADAATNWRSTIEAYILTGGRFLYTMDSIGGSTWSGYEVPLLPNVATCRLGEDVFGIDCILYPHAITTEMTSPFTFAFTYAETAVIAQSGMATIITETDSSGIHILTIAGEYGSGRVVYCASPLGLTGSFGGNWPETAYTGDNKLLVTNIVLWLAGRL
jgi:hypothetical protein